MDMIIITLAIHLLPQTEDCVMITKKEGNIRTRPIPLDLLDMVINSGVVGKNRGQQGRACPKGC